MLDGLQFARLHQQFRSEFSASGLRFLTNTLPYASVYPDGGVARPFVDPTLMEREVTRYLADDVAGWHEVSAPVPAPFACPAGPADCGHAVTRKYARGISVSKTSSLGCGSRCAPVEASHPLPHVKARERHRSQLPCSRLKRSD